MCIWDMFHVHLFLRFENRFRLSVVVLLQTPKSFTRIELWTYSQQNMFSLFNRYKVCLKHVFFINTTCDCKKKSTIEKKSAIAKKNLQLKKTVHYWHKKCAIVEKRSTIVLFWAIADLVFWLYFFSSTITCPIDKNTCFRQTLYLLHKKTSEICSMFTYFYDSKIGLDWVLLFYCRHLKVLQGLNFEPIASKTCFRCLTDTKFV